MSSTSAIQKIASQIALSSSKMTLMAFERHIEEKLNENTKKQESAKSKPKVNVNATKSF
ncbi:MAG: hypothetical protein RMY62_014045 [Nostoc sp. ZfuVER08]|jgi:hypothetical protein|uniref:Uncharacterized protein n=1 Tax=Nostoc punctiforme FACHB-252 TaxID=1357509 RepID=A0ABR8H7P8_NOSPU|nr:hypothetical protein [Nostoc punctiforme]MBD2611674.1 hypothetical protein [Nostoc punctiforme FACHB-252]MDZ8010681.1 hypothetical protein [Nostoc sp. ZfuVER08]